MAVRAMPLKASFRFMCSSFLWRDPTIPRELDLPSHRPVFIGLDSANGADGDLNRESLSPQV